MQSFLTQTRRSRRNKSLCPSSFISVSNTPTSYLALPSTFRQSRIDIHSLQNIMLPVAIIGGGLAGPVLALCLKKHGITSVMYETRSKDYQRGGNIALAPNALRVLDHIGVYDRLRTSGYNYEEIAFTNGAGHVLGKFLNGSQREYNFPALRIHRTTVREELVREVERQEIEVHWGKRCVGVKEEGEKSATVLFEGGEEVEAEFVIGTDGIHSLVRSFVAPGAEPAFSGLMGVMGTVMAEELASLDSDHGLQLPAMLFGASGSFAIMPANFGGEEVGYFATIEAADRGREGWATLEGNKEEMKKMLSERFLEEKSSWPELVRELCRKTPAETLTSWPFFSVPHLETWSSLKKRVTVIGDSAHAIPPTGGQGAAMAFEDAETLAYVLSRAFATDFQAETLPRMFEKWQTHRNARIAKVMDFTSKNGSLRKSSPHFYEQAAKEWLVWAVFKFMGPEGGAEWMYSYNAESVLGALA